MGKAIVRLPAYVTRVRLASGEHAYYWKLPGWATAKDPKTGKRVPAVRHGHPCPLHSCALGTSHDAAVEKAEALNAKVQRVMAPLMKKMAKQAKKIASSPRSRRRSRRRGSRARRTGQRGVLPPARHAPAAHRAAAAGGVLVYFEALRR